MVRGADFYCGVDRCPHNTGALAPFVGFRGAAAQAVYLSLVLAACCTLIMGLEGIRDACSLDRCRECALVRARNSVFRFVSNIKKGVLKGTIILQTEQAR